MEDNNKLIKKILKKYVISKVALFDGEEDVTESQKNLAMKYARIIRYIKQNPSSQLLSNKKLPIIRDNILEIIELDKKVEKKRVRSSNAKREARESISKCKELYSSLIEDDIDELVQHLVEKEGDQNNNQENKRLTTFMLNTKDVADKCFYFDYLKKVFDFQYKFALRTKNITGEQYATYRLLAEEDQLESLLNETIFSIKDLSFTFHYSPLKPLEMSLQAIEEFKDDIKSIMEANTEILKKVEYLGAIVDYPRDDAGRIVNRNDLNELYDRWQKYLEAYDYNASGMAAEEIYEKLHGEKKVSDRRKIIASYIDYAKQYIRAVEQGTFPHID